LAVPIQVIGFSHIGFTVSSVETFAATWGKALGISYWKIHDESAPGGIQLHGEVTGPLEVRVAFAKLGGTSLELIETRRGRTHHSEHLQRFGAGLHHVAFWVQDLKAELAKTQDLGLEVVMSPTALRDELRNRVVSATVRASHSKSERPASSEPAVPEFFAFLQTMPRNTNFALELLDAKFAEDYRALNGPYPYYPGELPA